MTSLLPKVVNALPGARRVVGTLRRVVGREEGRMPLLRRLPKGSVGMEIGVHHGDFSARLIGAVDPKELHLVDPWEFMPEPEYRRAWYGGEAEGGAAELDARYEGVRSRFGDLIDAGRVRVHRGYSEAVLATFPDGYFDWIYIDGNHLYDYVLRDLELSAQKIRAGGIICGDDYGVTGWWEDGVTRAVESFCRSRDVRERSILGTQFLLRMS